MPRYNLKFKESVINARQNLEYHITKQNTINQQYIRKTRTDAENRALHLYFKFVSDELLKIGYDYNYINVLTGEIISIPYTPILIKDWIWKPLQKTMFKIESTTKLTNPMINQMLEVLANWLGEKGIQVNFPNDVDLMIKRMNKYE